MKNKKEIGSYFELELAKYEEYHKNAIALNLGRSALRYIIRANNIKTINIPYYTCECIWETAKEENCEIKFYNVDFNFMPTKNFDPDEYILFTNYFGVYTDNVKQLSKIYNNLIVDNTMAFFAKPSGIASFYSTRKFFGVADGAYLYTNKKINEDFETDSSSERFLPCLRRIEFGSESGYKDIIKNEENNNNESIKFMSKLTKSILKSIDYENVKQIRLENSLFIQKELGKYNELKFNINEKNIPMRYPFMLNNNKIKEHCLNDRIFIATFWGIDENFFPNNSSAKYLQKYIFPIPIDQRYNLNDMKRIVKRIKEVI